VPLPLAVNLNHLLKTNQTPIDSMQFNELVSRLSSDIGSVSVTEVDYGSDPDINGVAAVDEATIHQLSFLESDRLLGKLSQTKASALILPQSLDLQTAATQRGIAWIATHQPRLLFARAISLFYQPFRPVPDIHPTAIIHPTASLGQDIYIGPYVVIQSGVIIGSGVCIHPHVVIYPGVDIGENATLHSGCVIHERTRIGANCVIHSGAVIGAEGFGFVPDASGWFKMEQSGAAVLADRVEVGCNSTVDRPAVGETYVGYNTKIDNLVQIGHNCQLGENCVMAGQSGIAGSSKLGNWVILAGQTGVSNQVTIGDRVTATAKAGIIGDVSAQSIVSGHPAIPHRQWLKNSAIEHRLPELYQIMKQLQSQVNQLQLQLQEKNL